MSLIPFDSLPGDARLWCFGASRDLDDAQTERLHSAMAEFIAEWTAHRRDLHASYAWLHGRILVVGVDESRAGASGCSIDALTGHLRRLGAELETDLLDATPVWFRGPAGSVRAVDRASFTEMAKRGDVSERTPVFDLTVMRLDDLRGGKLETTAGESWHRGLLTTD